MNIATRLANYFGLAPLHDVDLPDEPSATVTPLRPADTSPRHGSPGVDGPTASVSCADAVGHPQDELGEALSNLIVAACEVVGMIDRLDPTPGELAKVSRLQRKGRSSRE